MTRADRGCAQPLSADVHIPGRAATRHGFAPQIALLLIKVLVASCFGPLLDSYDYGVPSSSSRLMIQAQALLLFLYLRACNRILIETVMITPSVAVPLGDSQAGPRNSPGLPSQCRHRLTAARCRSHHLIQEVLFRHFIPMTFRVPGWAFWPECTPKHGPFRVHPAVVLPSCSRVKPLARARVHAGLQLAYTELQYRTRVHTSAKNLGGVSPLTDTDPRATSPQPWQPCAATTLVRGTP